jgi:hypothetical protein
MVILPCMVEIITMVVWADLECKTFVELASIFLVAQSFLEVVLPLSMAVTSASLAINEVI